MKTVSKFKSFREHYSELRQGHSTSKSEVFLTCSYIYYKIVFLKTESTLILTFWTCLFYLAASFMYSYVYNWCYVMDRTTMMSVYFY
jgi:hypothetical protein